MASIVKELYSQYQEALPHADPRTSNWLLVNNNPVYVWVLSLLYLCFVWIGPRLMRNRKAFSFPNLMVVYNLGLVALSLYMFVEILLSTSAVNYPWLCAKFNKDSLQNPKELRVAKVLWWYFFSKAIELLDTVLMILRKNERQVTFLHVFHHVSMLNIWWWVMMFTPGGLAYFGSGLNCLVHVVMYAYYGLSAIPSLRDKLWWKKYITKFQLTQFCITLTHTAYSLVSGCEFPVWGKHLLLGYMVIMLILFSNFYIRSYKLRKQQRALSKNGAIVQNGTKTNGTKTNGAANGTANGTANGAAHMTNGSAVTSKKRA